MYLKCNIPCNYFTVETKNHITIPVYVFVAFGIQRVLRICRIMFISVVSLALPYIFTLSHKRHVFGEKFLKCCFGFLIILSKPLLIQEEYSE